MSKASYKFALAAAFGGVAPFDAAWNVTAVNVVGAEAKR